MAFSGSGTWNREVFEALLEKAGEQGYLTNEDLQEIFPGDEEGRLRRNKLVAVLHQRGIKLRDDDENESLPLDPDFIFPELVSNLEQVSIDDTVSLYLKEMSLTPLLTVEEEIYLAQQIEGGEEARLELLRFADECSPARRMDLNQQIEVSQLARDNLIRANTRLVVSIARRYVGRGVPFLDLIQEGNIGLMKAVEKYEYRRGFRFSTYATWWIRQSITRALADQGRTIRVPVHMTDRLRQLFNKSRDMEQSLGRSPTTKELAAELQMDQSKVQWMLQVAQTPISLESPVGDEEESEFGMFVEDQNTPGPAQLAYLNILRDRVDQVLSTLPPREARVLRLRFGLGQDRPYTLEEVGQKFGLTRERIRQIESKALRRLRQPSRARLLRDLP